MPPTPHPLTEQTVYPLTPTHPSSIRASTCMSVYLLASLNLCRYGNGTRILAYGQSMGGDCFLTGMLYYLVVPG